MKCPYCNSKVILASSERVYGKGRYFGPIHICKNYPTCDAYVGCHKGTTRALGRLANKELREAKMAAHAAFDPLWKDRGLKRTDAYAWLAEKLGIKMRDCHIAEFDVDKCQQTIEACNEMIQTLKEE